MSSPGGLPTEIWESFVPHLPTVSAINDLRLTNRFFNDLIKRSIPIRKHLLSTVGLECSNTPPSFTDFIQTVLPYVDRMNKLQSKVILKHELPGKIEDRVAGGVYGIQDGTVLKFFAPGSANVCEWEIATPIDGGRVDASYFCFCPSADVAAVAQQRVSKDGITIHVMDLRSAQVKKCIEYYSDSKGYNSVYDMSITKSRLAVLMSKYGSPVNHLVVWDWDYPKVSMLDLPVGENSSMGFIDEFKLLYTLGATDGHPAVLVMIDTGTSDLATTSFSLPREAGKSIQLILENDAHIQSDNTPMAPFRDDPKQCLIVLEAAGCGRFLIFRVGALLEHHNTGKVKWDMWKEKVATPLNRISGDDADAWVSGCRFFATFYERNTHKLRVYDFSDGGQEGRLIGNPIPGLGVRRLEHTGEENYSRSSRLGGGTRGSYMIFTQGSTMEIRKLGATI